MATGLAGSFRTRAARLVWTPHIRPIPIGIEPILGCKATPARVTPGAATFGRGRIRLSRLLNDSDPPVENMERIHRFITRDAGISPVKGRFDSMNRIRNPWEDI